MKFSKLNKNFGDSSSVINRVSGIEKLLFLFIKMYKTFVREDKIKGKWFT